MGQSALPYQARESRGNKQSRPCQLEQTLKHCHLQVSGHFCPRLPFYKKVWPELNIRLLGAKKGEGKGDVAKSKKQWEERSRQLQLRCVRKGSKSLKS